MPLFKHTTTSEGNDYIETIAADRVKEDEITTVAVENRKVLLTRHKGQLYAIDSLCPHAAADLSRGSLRSWQLCCHEHDYCFDIRSGRIVWPEDEIYRLKRYEAKEENGIIFIRFAPSK